MSVFHSDHFEETDRFPRTNVDGSCVRRTVSFQTAEGIQRATAIEQRFQEWMMKCKKDEDKYYISQAFKPNELLLYFWDNDKQEMHLEALMTKVRLPIKF